MTSIPAESVEPGASPEGDDATQAAADRAFEADLSAAGLLDDTSELEARHAAPTPVTAPSPEKAVSPATTPDAKPGETPPAKAEPVAADVAPITPPEKIGEELAAKAVPLTYTVDGQARTVEGILEIPGEGAVIESAQLDRLKNILQTADKAITDNRSLRESAQRFDQLGGAEAYRQLQEKVAQLDAAGTRLLTTLREAFPGPENEAVLRSVFREAELDARDAAWKVRTTFTENAQKATEASGLEQQRGRAMEVALDRIKAAYPHYTADDVRAAQAHLAVYREFLFRPATAQEAAVAGVKPGEIIIDYPRMSPWAEERSQFRLAQGDAAKAEAARQKAEAENKARLSAATPAKTPARPAAHKGKPAATNKGKGELGPDDDGSYSFIKNRHLAGRFASEAVGD